MVDLKQVISIKRDKKDKMIQIEKTIEIEIGSKKYPKQLLDLEDPPEKLYCKGNISLLLDKNSLAIVGSRRMTRYGEDVTVRVAKALAKKGYTITSGFMYGVDTVAHEATLAVKGKTIAVLGSGINVIYPKENRDLYNKIIQEGGCVVSEYPEDFPPDKWTFPKRNRIVAALSLKGTLVIEAAEYSGSLITASYADALNRPLYAIPGSVFSPTSKGTNLLIRNGIAKCVTSVGDIS